MSEGLPLVAVVGRGPRQRLEHPLSKIARVEYWDALQDHAPDVLLIRADTDGEGIIEAFRSRFTDRAPERVVPVLAFTDGAQVSDEGRREWLERGAVDLVPANRVVASVLRRLPGRRPRTLGRRPPPPSTAGAAPILPPIGEGRRRAAAGEAEKTSRSPTDRTPPPTETTDPSAIPPASSPPPIPPLSVASIEPDSTASVFLRALAEYQEARRTVLHRLGRGAEEVLSRLQFHRSRAQDHLLGHSPAGSVGHWPREERATLNWPIEVGPPADARASTLLNISADGACIRVDHLPEDPRHVEVRMEVRGELRAQLVIRARWRRRTARSKWELGGAIDAIRIQDL